MIFSFNGGSEAKWTYKLFKDLGYEEYLFNLVTSTKFALIILQLEPNKQIY
jgi:hypothetical protein